MSDDGIGLAMRAGGRLSAVGNELHRLPNFLREGERVERMVAGRFEPASRQGLVVATDARLLVLYVKMIGGKTEDLPYDKLSSVEWKPGFGGGSMRIKGPGIKLWISQVDVKPGEKLVEYVRARIADGPKQAAAAPDILDQLTKLGALRDAGVLTEDEFSAKKAELLSRL